MLSGKIQYASSGNLHLNGVENSVNPYRNEEKKKKKRCYWEKHWSCEKLWCFRSDPLVAVCQVCQLGILAAWNLAWFSLAFVPGWVFVPVWCCPGLKCLLFPAHRSAQLWKSPSVPSCFGENFFLFVAAVISSLLQATWEQDGWEVFTRQVKWHIRSAGILFI